MRSRLKRVRLVGFEIEGINVGESSIQSGNEGTVGAWPLSAALWMPLRRTVSKLVTNSRLWSLSRIW